MIYLYAYSNHKANLDHLRRMTVLFHALTAKGAEVEMIVNDGRASCIARDLGTTSPTVVGTIFDIDYVAVRGDTLVIDSPELDDDRGKLEVFVEMFAKVFVIAHHCDQVSRYGETIIEVDVTLGEHFIASKYQPSTKTDRRLLFLGDSDASKFIAKNGELFRKLSMELLPGEYFYPTYENEVTHYFTACHESEDYEELILQSSHIITASRQVALEASYSGATVLYLDLFGEEKCIIDTLQKHNILVLDAVEIDTINGFFNTKRAARKVIDPTVYTYLKAAEVIK